MLRRIKSNLGPFTGCLVTGAGQEESCNGPVPDCLIQKLMRLICKLKIPNPTSRFRKTEREIKADIGKVVKWIRSVLVREGE